MNRLLLSFLWLISNFGRGVLTIAREKSQLLLGTVQAGWYVIDAFIGRKMSATSLECKKPEMECKKPEMLKTFPSYGIADAEIYKKWVLKQIKKDKPVLVVPCHGSRIANPKLPTLLESLVKTV